MRKAMILSAVPLILSAGSLMADGASIYKAKCASCHGLDGKGNAKMAQMLKLDPASLVLAGLKKPMAELVKITSNGQGKMPAFKGKLKEKDIQDVVAFGISGGKAPKK